MNVLKNERGYALLLVLLTIVIIGIFVPLITANIFSSSAQYQKTEESIQREKLEEMAKKHFEETVLRAINDYIDFLDIGWEPPGDWEDINQEDYIFEEAMDYIEDKLISEYPSSLSTYHFEHENQKFGITFDEFDGVDIEFMKIYFSIITSLKDEVSLPQEAEIELPDINIS